MSKWALRNLVRIVKVSFKGFPTEPVIRGLQNWSPYTVHHWLWVKVRERKGQRMESAVSWIQNTLYVRFHSKFMNSYFLETEPQNKCFETSHGNSDSRLGLWACNWDADLHNFRGFVNVKKFLMCRAINSGSAYEEQRDFLTKIMLKCRSPKEQIAQNKQKNKLRECFLFCSQAIKILENLL